MTETTKQTPKQTVIARVPSAYLHTREDKRMEIRRLGHFDPIGDGATTAAGAWKNAAKHLEFMDAKDKQAQDFNAMARKPVSLVKVDEAPAVKTSHGLAYSKPKPRTDDRPPLPVLSRKERQKRKTKRRITNASRAKNRKRAA